MDTGINELYGYQHNYCLLKVLYNECKWYQFKRKNMLKTKLYFVYPLMKGELNMPNRILLSNKQ